MKRWIIRIVLLCLAVFLTGCDGQEVPIPQEDTASTTVAVAQAETVPTDPAQQDFAVTDTHSGKTDSGVPTTEYSDNEDEQRAVSKASHGTQPSGVTTAPEVTSSDVPSKTTAVPTEETSETPTTSPIGEVEINYSEFE